MSLDIDGSLAWLYHCRKIQLTSSQDESMLRLHPYLLQSSFCRRPTYPPNLPKYERAEITDCIKNLFQGKTWKYRIPGLHLFLHLKIGTDTHSSDRRYGVTRSSSGSQYTRMYTPNNYLIFGPTSSLAQHQ